MVGFGVVEVFLFICVVCYFFNKNRTDDMVDVISARFQEVYTAWRSPNFNGDTNLRPEERISTDALRRFGDEHRRRKALTKELEKQAIESCLYQIKETIAPSVPLPERPVQGLACRHCAPSNSLF